MNVVYDAGLWLSGPDLWLDPQGVKPFAFVSHAHTDHLRGHEVILASPLTAALARARLRKRASTRYEILEFGREARLSDLRQGGPGGDLRLKLLPAGHVLGSAMVRVEGESGSVLYTGDFKLREGMTTEQCRPEQADILVMETTYGLPRYVMPPTEEVRRQIVGFCHEAFDAGETPVFFAYALGKAQELMAILGLAGLPIAVHRSVASMAAVYEGGGCPLPAHRAAVDPLPAGHVLICPPGAHGLDRMAGIRTAMVSGWALNPSARYQYGCDAAFALSDHADYPDLLRTVALVRPRKVYTVHGFAVEFAADLRARGIEAWALGRENQMELQAIVTRDLSDFVRQIPLAKPPSI